MNDRCRLGARLHLCGLLFRHRGRGYRRCACFVGKDALALKLIEIVLLTIDVPDVPEHQIAFGHILRDTGKCGERLRLVMRELKAAALHADTDAMPERLSG